jgi:hypothetical protein
MAVWALLLPRAVAEDETFLARYVTEAARFIQFHLKVWGGNLTFLAFRSTQLPDSVSQTSINAIFHSLKRKHNSQNDTTSQ